jgi:hypothetical protein
MAKAKVAQVVGVPARQAPGREFKPQCLKTKQNKTKEEKRRGRGARKGGALPPRKDSVADPRPGRCGKVTGDRAEDAPSEWPVPTGPPAAQSSLRPPHPAGQGPSPAPPPAGSRPLERPGRRWRRVPPGPRSGRRSARRRRAARRTPPSWARTQRPPASAPRPPGTARPNSPRRRRQRQSSCWALPSWDRGSGRGRADGVLRGTRGARFADHVSIRAVT